MPSASKKNLDQMKPCCSKTVREDYLIEYSKPSLNLIAATVKKASMSSIGEVLKVGPGRFAFNGELMEMDVAPGDFCEIS